MSKQTAVEWLVEELRGDDDKGDFIFNGVITSELIGQAKAMEREQIEECFEDGYGSGYRDNGKDGKKYYNETYK